MSETTPLEVYAQSLASFAYNKDGLNCIERAAVVLDQYNQTIAAVPELTDADVNCGCVLDVRYNYKNRARSLHASSFIVAKFDESRIEYVPMDGFFGNIGQDSLFTDNGEDATHLQFVDWATFDKQSVVYTQRQPIGDTVIARPAKKIRKVPMRLNPQAHRTVVLGEYITGQVLDELLSTRLKLDTTKLPVLLLESNW